MTRRRPGAALLAVLMALALTSALVVGGAFVTRQAAAGGRVAHRGAELEARLEEAIAEALANWDSSGRARQPVGETWQGGAVTTDRIRVDTWITRVGSREFWIVAEAADNAKPMLRKRLGAQVQLAIGWPGLLPERGWVQLP